MVNDRVNNPFLAGLFENHFRTKTPKILIFLIRNSGNEFTRKDLAKIFGCNFGTIKKIINEFYEKGLLEERTEGYKKYYSGLEKNKAKKKLKEIISSHLSKSFKELC